MLHLLDCALHGRTPDPALATDVDWAALYALSQAHKIDALLLNAVCALPDGAGPSENMLAAWQQGAMTTMFAQAALTDQLHRLLDALYGASVRAVVLKGVVIKALYPEPDLRTMSDADILVPQDQFAVARSVMEQNGYTVVGREPGVIAYGGPEGLRVELHEKLFDTASYGFLSRLDEAEQFPISLTRREAVYGGEAYVYPPMEHALFMLCHMAKHMITTGFGLRQATDFALFAEAYDKAVDWPAFWRAAGRLGLAPFASAMLKLGARHLSLPQGGWADGAADDPDAAEGLLLDLLDAGVFGNRTEERRRSAAVVYRAVDAKDGDSGRVRRALFPSAKTLKAPYLYARDHPALLPAAWVHRFALYAFRVVTGKARRDEATEGLRIADARLDLLNRLGLRDRA